MKEIPLRGKYGEGKFALVDDADYGYLMQFSWHLSKHGYPATQGYKITGKIQAITMHRLLLKHKKGLLIDHHNRNKLDHQRSNLRYVTPLVSANNTGKKRKNSSSVFKGVHKHSGKTNPWKVEIMHKGKKAHIGLFPSEHIAAVVYDLWAVDLKRKNAVTNFPVVAHTKIKKAAV